MQEAFAGGQIHFLGDQPEGHLSFRRLFGLDRHLELLDEGFQLGRESEIPLMARTVGPHSLGRRM